MPPSRNVTHVQVPDHKVFRRKRISCDKYLLCNPATGRKLSPADADASCPSNSRAVQRTNFCRHDPRVRPPGNTLLGSPANPCAPRTSHPACRYPSQRHWYKPSRGSCRSSTPPGASCGGCGGVRRDKKRL